MAGSRLEKFGSVFTRVRDLLRSGVLKESEKPSWFDVYAAFPPKREPVYQKPKQSFGKAQDPVQEIFYQEDTIRVKFYEVYGNGPRAFDLSQSNFVSTCQRFVEKYQDLEAQGEVDEEKLFEGTSRALLAEGIILRRRAGNRIPTKGLPGGVLQEAEARGPVLDLKSQEAPKDGQKGQVEETTQPPVTEAGSRPEPVPGMNSFQLHVADTLPSKG